MGRLSTASAKKLPLRTLTYCFSVLAAFYGGFIAGVAHTRLQKTDQCISQQASSNSHLENSLRLSKVQQQREEIKRALGKEDVSTGSARFPNTVLDFLVGASRVNRNDFAAKYDTGVPLDISSKQNNEVVILYSSLNSLPKSDNSNLTSQAHLGGDIPLASVDTATENCDYVNVILTDHSGSKRKQCIALFGQYEAFHIQKFMRLPPENKAKLNSSAPLRLVNRGAQASGRKSTDAPTLQATRDYWSILVPYLQTLDSVLEKLRPVAEKAATADNNIIVMVCNYGQSELLLNFICACQRRNLDLSSIIVFATDEITRDLISGMGVNVFYDEINYKDMPTQAARQYGDRNFRMMMMAKVFCVQMVAMLGYNVLFQDVDVVWYRNPLEYFEKPSSVSTADLVDVYFQDDGNHALFYAPYSANTGFYYVRHNDKTLNFLNSFLVSGNLIIGTKSHQIPLVALLQEHASMYGLKVKIFSRDEDDFPGGHAFHRRKDFMRSLIANDGTVTPYIFHMSWTLNKDNKIKYFQQLGEWYLNDKCKQKHLDQITKGGNNGSLSKTCCLSEAAVKCHYRDKPSKIPCKDNEPIDKGGKSFW